MTESGDAPKHNVRQLVALGALVLLVLRALVVPFFLWDMRNYPIDYFFGEGDMLFYAQRILHGKTIYTNSTALPLIGNVYPPLYPWILSLWGRIVPLTLGSARALQIVPLLGIMLLIARWARRESVPLAVACAAALLVPCCYHFGEYIIAPRPDSWMLLFLLAAFYFIWTLEQSARTEVAANLKLILLGALFSTLSLYAKHSALVALAALQIHVLVRRPRIGLTLIGATIGCCALLLAVTLGLYGTVFFESMLSPQAPRHIDWGRLQRFLLPALGSIGVILVCGLGWLVNTLRRRRWTLLHSFVIGSLPLAVVVLIDGGGPNHLLPLFFALLLAATLAARDLLAMPVKRDVFPLALALGVVVQLWLLSPAEDRLTAPRGKEYEAALFVGKFLTDEREPVYAEREWGAVADRETADAYFIEPIHLNFMKKGKLPEDVPLQPFRDQVFSHVLLFKLNFQPAYIRKEIEKYYQPLGAVLIKVCAGTAGPTPVLLLVRKSQRPMVPAPAPAVPLAPQP